MAPADDNGLSGCETIVWQTPSLTVELTIDREGIPRISHVLPLGIREVSESSGSRFFSSTSLPINAVRSIGEGNTFVKTSKSLIGSYLSDRLRLVDYTRESDDDSHTLSVICRDDRSGLETTHFFVVFNNAPVLRSYVRLRNTSGSSITINQASSLVIGGLAADSKEWWNDYTLLDANNSWFREAQWNRCTLNEAGLGDQGLHQLNAGHLASMSLYSKSSRGSFSTGTYLPMGALERQDGTDTWLWQIEASGSWRWEIGDNKDNLYLAAGGPTYFDHQWQLRLEPGETFDTVPVACCRVAGSIDQAFAAFTDYRRHIVPPHPDFDRMPIIFNDYMNCLMGDPTEEKIEALLAPAVRAGAEYFVIDAGWYADDGDWWDDVGLWEPSKKRFPSGFEKLLNSVRANGLIPGLWIEPEVIGVRSIMAERLPREAFFEEQDERVVERGRYHLDYSQRVVREYMDGVVQRLIAMGVGYFKFDYNIEVSSGSDSGGRNPGVAHLEHQRAYLGWVSSLIRRHPTLVIENCSSGGMRMEYAMLAVHTLQSTSDQQDPLLYAAIAAAAPTAVIPEQSATWAYPQKSWSDEKNAFSVVNSLLGRVHLSGRLDQLSASQFELVKEGLEVYREIRRSLRTAHPYWPLGLPRWQDDWIALAMVTASSEILLSVWRRGGSTDCQIPLTAVTPTGNWQVRLLYPTRFETRYELAARVLQVTLPATPCARLFRISKMP